MNKKVLQTLEFNKIIDMLVSHATSDKGREYCSKCHPITNMDRITRYQKETSDALTRIFKKGSISFQGSHDVSYFGKRLEIGGTLNAIELLHIASLLEVSKRAKSYGRREREDEENDSLDQDRKSVV